MKAAKKLFSLLLVLALTLSGCSKSNPAPDPGITVDALLLTLFHKDTSKMEDLFGYTSYDAVISDWMDGEDIDSFMNDAFISGFTESLAVENVSISDETLLRLSNAFIRAIGRIPFSCQTTVLDEDSATAAVTVTVTPFPDDCLSTAFQDYILLQIMQNPQLVNDEAALFDFMMSAMADYVDQLQPTGEPKTFMTPCSLTGTTINGQYRSIWIPAEPENLGLQLVSVAFNFAA